MTSFSLPASIGNKTPMETCHDVAVEILAQVLLAAPHQPVTASITRYEINGGLALRFHATVDEDVLVDRVRARFVGLARGVTNLLEHGYQSWSTVRRATPDDVRSERSSAPPWFRSQMLADGDGAGHVVAGDTFLLTNLFLIGALSASQQFTRFYLDGDDIISEWLFDNTRAVGGQVLISEEIWLRFGEPSSAYSNYAEFSGARNHARASRPARPAWCSWYHYFGDISPDIIRENLAAARIHGIDVVQIDDGWQREIGVWTDVNERWGEPLGKIARDITRAGCTPGIWTAPFLAVAGGTLAREHPEWLVRQSNGAPVLALQHGNWGGEIYALDTSRDDVLEHIATSFKYLVEQGFSYFKIDFCHAAAVPGYREDESITRAQALRRGLEVIRRAIGDDAYLVGCGSPLLSAVGVVDAMRVSEDVAPYFEPREFLPGFLECSVGARNSIEASVLRAPLHGRWFTLDPDCVLLRSSHSDLSEHERFVLAEVASATSDFIVLSDRLSDYGPQEWARARALFDAASPGARDLIDPFATPVTLSGTRGVASIDWSPAFFSSRPLNPA
jgi:alpha-galactosidase